ncbi:TonB-dependent receptor plug domain-containing protein [Prevotella sp. E9-3]|uniref:TonB-dependent receptor domain-containing protein n=1 Tax=Prevotella sp. E9-3 TaxID=2913621 RepID=UPI001EDBF11F|nr:TonB-dependent receptor [Prevotella sp. E9-3]UKK48900.1 TonB-dependent receptor plug domain-containing protein [Prevotella sp. E9-3]
MEINRLICFCVLGSSLTGYAQNMDSLSYGNQQLHEVQVVAKSKARQLQQQAYALSVVDLAKVHTTNPTLSKVLNQVTSVRVREDGGMGSNYSFSMNGFSGNQVKFFLDGMPMDHFGSSFSLASISASLADRIEVYKGVLPVSLGTDALGGAVNIVSRVNANYLDASYSMGSFGTHRVSLDGAYTDCASGFTVRTNAFFNYSDNDYKVDAPIVDLSTGLTIGQQRVRRFNDRYHSMGLRFETGLVNKSWADYLLFGVIASENRKQIQTGATMDAVYGDVKQHSYSLIPSLRYKKTDLFTPGMDLSLFATYNMVNDYNTDTAQVRYNWSGEQAVSNSRGEGYLTDATIHNREWQAMANLNYVIDRYQSLTLNHVFTTLRHRQDDAEHPEYPLNNVAQKLTKNITGLGYQVRVGRWTANVFGKYYQMHSSTHKLLDQFLATERYEQVSADKRQLGYGAATTYFLLPGLQAKLSFEQTYRMPEALELFGDGFLQKSNTDLRPESSKNLNAGLLFDHRFGLHHVMAEANYIYRYTKDFIYKGISLTNNPTTAYENIGKAITHGIETSVQYDYSKTAHAGFNLTWQDIKDRQKTDEATNSYVSNGITENLTYGQRMPNIPYFFVNGDLSWNFHNLLARGNTLTLAYDCHYVYKYYLSFPGLGRPDSKKYIPTQFSHNASITYLMAGGKYSIGMECNNLSNEALYDNYRLQKPGRSVAMKFRLYLSKM